MICAADAGQDSYALGPRRGDPDWRGVVQKRLCPDGVPQCLLPCLHGGMGLSLAVTGVVLVDIAASISTISLCPMGSYVSVNEPLQFSLFFSVPLDPEDGLFQHRRPRLQPVLRGLHIAYQHPYPPSTHYRCGSPNTGPYDTVWVQVDVTTNNFPTKIS